jgi:hypothetical protein
MHLFGGRAQPSLGAKFVGVGEDGGVHQDAAGCHADGGLRGARWVARKSVWFPFCYSRL